VPWLRLATSHHAVEPGAGVRRHLDLARVRARELAAPERALAGRDRHLDPGKGDRRAADLGLTRRRAVLQEGRGEDVRRTVGLLVDVLEVEPVQAERQHLWVLAADLLEQVAGDRVIADS